MKVTIDSWDGSTTRDEAIEATRFEEVEAFIRRLDQKKHTMVSIGDPEKPALMIGGGRGEYVVLWMSDGDHWFSLKTGFRDGPKRLITVGGQAGDFESELVVVLAQALEAARYFFLHGELDPSMKWEP